MNARVSAIGPLIVLLLLAALSLWLERAVQIGIDGSGKHRHDPDFWVEKFQIKRFGPDGRLQNTLSAVSMQHFPDDDTSVLVGPEVKYHRASQVRIAADKGLVGPDGKVVHLVENVVIERQTPDGGFPLRIQTPELRVFPDEERASSTQSVVINQGRSRITGNGLEVDNKAGVSVLHGRVSATIYRDQLP